MSNSLDPDQARDFVGLILIQTVCKGYQQTTKVATSAERVNFVSVFIALIGPFRLFLFELHFDKICILVCELGKFRKLQVDGNFFYLSQKIGFDLSCKMSPGFDFSCFGDSLLERSKPIFWENYFTVLIAEIFTQRAKNRDQSIH